MVTKEMVTNAFRNINVQDGDIIMVHSSFKSLGEVENGAQTVIEGIKAAIGDSGTLVFPTFCQKDFVNSYKTWYMDKPSDTGYLTNYFRKLPGSLRSDHPTHSVAAAGKLAQELTKTHGLTGKRFGNLGDTPFSVDSPYEKMYHLGAKIVLLGVDERYITFRHYAEYLYMEALLASMEGHPDYEAMKDQLWAFGKRGVWPHSENKYTIQNLKDRGIVYTGTCGDAQLLCVSVKPLVDFVLNALNNQDRAILKIDDKYWDINEYIAWETKAKTMQNAL